MTECPSTDLPNLPRDPRWRRVNDLFHQALDRKESERETFLLEACGQDAGLEAEVRSLIAAHSRTDQFLEAPAAPVELGQYRIARVLGRGGMGIVYLAEDTRLGRRVALKAISPEYTHDAKRRERLRREARAAAALAHPGIATIYALEEFGDEVFIAAEYVPGETLREEITRGRATAVSVLETAIGLAGALGAAHDAGVIHRDLKPENVIRTVGGAVKILDFGLAQMAAEGPEAVRLTEHGRILGTPAYMAPEQIRREPVDARADVFAFGILLHELLTGQHPFPGNDTGETIARILESEPLLVRELPDDPDRRLRHELLVVARTCLAKAPAARFVSAHTLLAALVAIREGGTWQNSARRPGAAMKWWEFHQGATCIAYTVLMLPLWRASRLIGGRPGLLLFVLGLAATVAASVVRLHLWFAASSMPEEWQAQREHSRRWLRTSEVTLVTVLAVAGLWVVEASATIGGILVCAAVAVLLSFTVIEPATTRAAFRRF
jgi:serine/threonine-protein kinase